MDLLKKVLQKSFWVGIALAWMGIIVMLLGSDPFMGMLISGFGVILSSYEGFRSIGLKIRKTGGEGRV